jgi:hypothetical protein
VPGVSTALALLAALSTHAPATPVQLSLRATFELQCGWPGPSVAITFPAREGLPAHIAPATVAVDGRHPASVERRGRVLTLAVARPGGVICDSIGPGVVRIVFARTAGIRNPDRPGTYTLRAAHGASTASGTFRVS